jgi:hypothetical protein
MRHGPPALFALVIVAGLGAASSSVRSSAEDIQGVRDEPVTFRSADATLSGTLFPPGRRRSTSRSAAVPRFGPSATKLVHGPLGAEHGRGDHTDSAARLDGTAMAARVIYLRA